MYRPLGATLAPQPTTQPTSVVMNAVYAARRVAVPTQPAPLAKMTIAPKPVNVPFSKMTPTQQAAYIKAMQGAGKAAAEAAAMPHSYADRRARYAALRPTPYPPPPPPIVQEAQDAAATAVQSAAAANAATSAAAAQAAASAAATAAVIARRKAAGAPNNVEARAAASSAGAAMQSAATAVAKWTKEPAASAQARLEQAGNVAADQQARMQAGGILATFNAVAQTLSTAQLDWRFWTGLGAAIYGTWLRARRA